MVPERLTLAGAALVVVASVIAAAVAPGVIAVPDTGPEREPPGFLDIEEVTIAPGDVSGATATLTVETRLTHRRGRSENVTVLLRATDLESGFVETTRRIDVEPIRGDREVAVVGNLTVERAGGYRIETIVYQDGERVAYGAKAVRGVGTLQPAYARTPVTFHEFQGPGADQPVIEYSIADTVENRTTLEISTHLTNTGDEAAGGLRLVLKARQADSNIIADETTVSVGQIEPGRTVTPTAEMTVPDGYNYYLDAVLWKDGVIVGTARSAANLAPTETISVNQTRREIGLEVSDFERDARAGEPPGRTVVRTAVRAQTPGQPGFTPVVAIVALLGTALLLWRRSQ